MGEIPADVPFKVIFDGCDVAFWNIPLNKHYWVIEKDKPIPHSFFDLENDINSLIEENEQLQLANGEMEDYLARLEEQRKICIEKGEWFNKILNELQQENKTLKEENEQLKMHMKSAKAHLEGGHTKKAIERLKIIDIR